MAKELQKTTDNLPVDPSLFTGADTGFEGTSAQTFKTPLVKVLQQLSPELKRSDAKFIQNAVSGNFCNTATNEVSEEIEIVVLRVEHVLIAWKPERGGFVGRYPKAKESGIVSKVDGLKKWDASGNEVIDTIEFQCMDINNPMNIFILPLSTTSLKYAKAFATRLRMLQVQGKQIQVSWAGVWKLKTVEEKNDKGSWYTVGNTAEFVRLITAEEKDSYVIPAKEMLKNAETDYSAIDTHAGTQESEQY